MLGWADVFVALFASHHVGDYLLQTEWQAVNKHGGLSGPPAARRALFSHIATYTLSFVPAMIWLWSSRGAWVFGVLALIAIPHLIQDDGRALAAYSIRVKKADIDANPMLAAALDQSFHLLALFGTALLVGS